MTTQELFLKEFGIVLTEKEAQQFAPYQLHIVRAAMASTNRWLTRKAAMVPPIVIGRNGIVRSVLNTVLFRNGTAKPKVMPKFKPLAKRAEELRADFQRLATDGTWTLTTEECSALIKQNDVELLRSIFAELGRFGEDQQTDAIDLLEWKLSMVTL
jgi:hypothetical protein